MYVTTKTTSTCLRCLIKYIHVLVYKGSELIARLSLLPNAHSKWDLVHIFVKAYYMMKM